MKWDRKGLWDVGLGDLYHTCLATLAIESIFNDNAGRCGFHVGIIRTGALRAQEHIVSVGRRQGPGRQGGGQSCPVVGTHQLRYMISM